MLPTRMGPLPTRRASAAPLWAGRLPSTLTLTGRSSRRGCPAGVNTPGAGIADEQATGAADVTGAAGPSSTPAPVTPAAVKRPPHNRTPLLHRHRQVEEQPVEVRERGRGKRGGATYNRRGGLHRQPRVATIAGSNNSLTAIPVTLSMSATLLPRPRAVRRRRAVTRPATVT